MTSPAGEVLAHVAAAMREHAESTRRNGRSLPPGYDDLTRVIRNCAQQRTADAFRALATKPWEVPDMHPLSMTTRQVAAMTGMSNRKIQTLIADGRLTAIKVDGCTLVTRQAIEEFLLDQSPRVVAKSTGSAPRISTRDLDPGRAAHPTRPESAVESPSRTGFIEETP